MKTLVKTSALALILSAGLASPAFADVQVTGTVDVNKKIVINVDTTKDKNVNVDVKYKADPNGSAQSDAILNATVDNVHVGPISDNVTDEGISKKVETKDSVNRNTGIVQFNQDAGQASNQGNVVSVAAVFAADPKATNVVHSEAYGDQRVTRSSSVHREGFENVGQTGSIDLVAKTMNAYNGNTGITQGNQNVGVGNNQHNILSAAVGDNAVVALSDAGLGQEIAGNSVLDINTLKEATVSGSLNGNAGITSVNQATGAFNNQATVISIAALSSAVGLGQ
jgi:hypothetical protein